MPEITLKTAERIISLNKTLADCRRKLRVLEGAVSVKVVVTCENGIGFDHRRDELVVNGNLKDPRGRTAIGLVRQGYLAQEAGAIRELRQLGAEVPNG